MLDEEERMAEQFRVAVAEYVQDQTTLANSIAICLLGLYSKYTPCFACANLRSKVTMTSGNANTQWNPSTI